MSSHCIFVYVHAHADWIESTDLSYSLIQRDKEGIIWIMHSVVLTNHMSWHAQVNILYISANLV